MRRFGPWYWWLMALLVLLAVGGAGWGYTRIHSALPAEEGSLLVDGISARVEILRDSDGVPHVRAVNETDAYFALGLVHAQDRLWQMEFQRRLAAGRLAEVLGPEALPTDRIFRTLGLARVAETQWARTGRAPRTAIDAYVRGVNAWLALAGGRRLPVEFGLLGYEPEPWRGPDVLAFAKVMAWLLSTNWRDELLRARLITRVGVEGAAALMPVYTPGAPVVLPEGLGGGGAVPPGLAGARLPAEVLARVAGTGLGLPAAAVGAIGASNNWVVAGSRSVTGRPLLANDPHLDTKVPAIWYLAHLQGGRLDAVGATIPGLPGVIIGHNQRVAWGVTNVMTDNQDLFVERVNARNQALFRGTWEPMRLVRERIRVRGGAPETLLVRITRHGPLLSDVLEHAPEALALRWTALDESDGTVEAFLGVGTARNWQEFSSAIERLHVPMQNFVYADVDGNIGYAAPGAIPVRTAGDGTLPAPGWTGEAEWAGYVPRGRLPRTVNPRRGYLVTANNQILPDGAPYLISSSWEPGYRALRITELIEAKARLSLEDFAAIQADVRSAQVPTLLPWLRQARVADDAVRGALARLESWDGALSADSAPAALYQAWVAAAARRVFADELGEELWREYAQDTPVVTKALHGLATRRDASWCDDVRTDGREGCDAALGGALQDALRDMARLQGTGDIARWRWGAVNEVSFPHRPLDANRLLRPFFSRSVQAGGDANTVNPVLRVNGLVFVASYRQIVDLANFDASRFVLTVGQSGHLASGHFADQLPKWSQGQYLPMRYSREAVDGAVSARLELRP